MTETERRSVFRDSRTLPLIIIAAVFLLTVLPSVCYPKSAPDVPEKITVSQTAPATDEETETGAESQTVPSPEVLPDNPVDAFFETYTMDYSTSSNADVSAYRRARADAWLAEVEHGYAMLKELANPHLTDKSREKHLESIDRSRESFLAYAEESTYLQATVMASNVFSVSPSDDFIFAGSAAGGYRLQLLGDMYRAEALGLYDMIERLYILEECPELFVFDAEEFLSAVTEKYDIVLPAGEA